MLKWVLLFIAVSIPAWAACTGSSPNLSAPDTGNAQTNMTNLSACMAIAVDGDTITITKAAFYDSPTSDSCVSIPARSGTPAAYVTIKSDGTIPAGRASLSDIAQYAIIETPSNAAPICFAKNSSYWKFTGVVFQTASSNYAAGKYVTSPLIFTDSSATISERPHHLIIDQIICRPYEAVVPHLNRTAQQCYQTEGPNVTFSNSYIYGFGGVSNDASQVSRKDISAVTASSTPTATSTAHGLGTGNTYAAAIEGGTGNWTRINGMSYITTTDANSFTIKKRIGLAQVASNVAKVYILYYAASNLQAGDSITLSGYTIYPAFNGTYTISAVGTDPDTAPYFTITTSGISDGNYCASYFKTCGRYDDAAFVTPNMTGAGALSGTVYAKVDIGDWSLNSYAFLQIGGDGPFYIYNNFCQAAFSCLFTGGGGGSSLNTATLSASAAGQGTFVSLGNLQVGDLLAVQVTGNPTLGESCQWRFAATGCGYYMAAKVLTINTGTKVVTWEGYGNQPLVSGESGTLTISGTTATCLTGCTWIDPGSATGYVTGLPIHIGGSDYIIYSHDSATQLTLESAPANGTYPWSMNTVADVPGLLYWNGPLPSSIYFRRNEISKDASISYGNIFKAASELKSLANSVIEGTHYTGLPVVTFGEPTYNQTGSTPWTRKQNNVERGGLVDYGEHVLVSNGDDPYRTAIVNYDGTEKTGTRNNTWTDYLILNASSWDIPIGIGGYDPLTTFQHVAILTSAASTREGAFASKFGGVNGCGATRTPPYGVTQAYIKNNILAYGLYGFTNDGSCMPSPSTQILYNTFTDPGGVGSGTILAAFPTGTKYAAAQSNIGLHTGCDGTVANWKNCYLDDSSASRAAASDGRDIGPDIDLINDLTNDYSCVAGLCNTLTGIRTAGAFSIGTTSTSMTFTIQGTVAANCTLKLYTDPARLTLAIDTNNSGKQACDRAGNTVAGKQVTFVLGSQNPLSSSTTYYYKIGVTDSGEVMVGSFTTIGTGGGTNVRGRVGIRGRSGGR